jgi:hypothetical protein
MFWLPLILTPILFVVVPDVLFAVLDGVVVPVGPLAVLDGVGVLVGPLAVLDGVGVPVGPLTVLDGVVVPVGPLVMTSRPKENDNKEKITILARIIDFILAINIKLLKSEEFRQSILTAFLLTTFCLKFVYEIMILC